MLIIIYLVSRVLGDTLDHPSLVHIPFMVCCIRNGRPQMLYCFRMNRHCKVKATRFRRIDLLPVPPAVSLVFLPRLTFEPSSVPRFPRAESGLMIHRQLFSFFHWPIHNNSCKRKFTAYAICDLYCRDGMCFVFI